jgi:hypothetical protein
MKKTITLTPGAVIEPVGDDVMIMMPGNTDILRISGPAAETLRKIVAGQPIDPLTPTILELADQGIISTSGVSRRGLIRAGAIGTGAGLAVIAMPGVAAASSINRIEIRGFLYGVHTDDGPNFDGPWSPGIANYFGFDSGAYSPPLLSPGMPVPPPTTDINDVSALSLYIGPAQPLILSVAFSALTGGELYIDWESPGIDPGDQAIGEFTWDTPDGTLYYRVTFRKDWSSFAPDPL